MLLKDVMKRTRTQLALDGLLHQTQVASDGMIQRTDSLQIKRAQRCVKKRQRLEEQRRSEAEATKDKNVCVDNYNYICVYVHKNDKTYKITFARYLYIFSIF